MTKFINYELCDLIRKAQGERSQNQFAQQCGVSSSAFSKIYIGDYTPTAKTLKKIAEKAHNGVTYSMLLTAAGLVNDLLYNNERSAPVKERKGVLINVYGEIAAGIPIEAIEDILDQEEITKDMAATGEYIALRIKGTSMEPRIMDGDVVIIRIQEDVENNEIAAIFVNGNEVTLKRIKKEENGIWLMPNNPAFTPLFYSKKECAELPVRILGKMVELRAKF